MIPIPSQVKADLLADIDNFFILVYIQTPSGETDFYISTREGEWDSPSGSLTYYEDLGLDVKGLKESIDFKTKKIKLSSSTISLSNLKPSVDSQRFSDRVDGTLLNAKVKISLATSGLVGQSSNAVELAYLKVTRYSHDDKTVTLQCDELLADALYQELPNPDYTFYKDYNTYEVYNEKRVPVLYGHLKEAPAITLIDDDNKIKVLPDRAELTGEGIVGIKRMKNLPSFTHDSFTDRQASILPDQDILTVKLGDAGARVYRVAPRQLNGRLLDIHWDRQFDIYNNYIEFYTDESADASEMIDEGALMVGELSKLVKATTYLTAYSVHPNLEEFSNQYKRYPLLQRDNNEDMDLLSQTSCYLTDENFNGDDYHIPSAVRDIYGGSYSPSLSDVGVADHYVIKIPSVVFEFEELSCDTDIWTDPYGVEAPSDFHLIGGCKIQMVNNATLGSLFDLELDFFPGSADFTFGIEGYEDDETNNYNIWQGEQPIAFVNNVISGATNDLGNTTITGLEEASGLKEHTDAIKSVCPYRLEIKGFNSEATTSNVVTDYRHSFNVPNNGSQDNEINQWRCRGDWIQQYPIDNIKSLILNVNPSISGNTSSDELHIDLYGEFSGMFLKRTWFQSDAFNNKFFLNARGKYNLYADTTRVKRVEGLGLYYYSENEKCGSINPSSRQTEDDVVLMLLVDYLSNDRLKYKMINGEQYQLAIKLEHSPEHSNFPNEINYLFDLEMSNMDFSFNSGNNLAKNTMWINGTLLRNEAEEEFSEFETGLFAISTNIKLIYVKISSNIGGSQDGYPEAEVVEGEEVDDFTVALTSLDSDTSNVPWDSHVVIELTTEAITDDAKELIRKPSAILQDLISREIPSMTSPLLYEKNIDDHEYRLDFSIDENEKTIDILQKFTQNTNFFYKTRLMGSQPSIIGMVDSHSADKHINVDYITKNSFDRTKIEDLVLRCRVKYGYDYIKEEYTKETPIATAGLVEDGELIIGDNLEMYLNYYGISHEEARSDTYLLEHEAPYIQDEYTALRLREHLYSLYKNQHLIIKFSINLSNAFELETGDVISFVDSSGTLTNMLGVNPFGLDITQEQYLPYPNSSIFQNRQTIYPKFMITSINKSLKGVDIECIQIHSSEDSAPIPDYEGFDALPGDVDLDGVANTISDYELLRGYLLGTEDLNEAQLINADVNSDFIVNNDDLVLMLPSPTIVGDVTNDGTGLNYLSITQ